MSGKNSTMDYDYSEEIETRNSTTLHFETGNVTTLYSEKIRMMYLITYSLVLILGVTLNLIVIVISCLKSKKSSMVARWIMALAVTHLVCSAFIVFQFLYAYNNFEWNYGQASCKLSSYITYGSMFSTAAMLSLWTINSAFSRIKCINNCENCNIFLILFSWSIAAVLACPSLFSREIRKSQCIDDYDLDKNKITQDGVARLKAVVITRFLFGVFVPALIIFLNCLTSVSKKCNDCKKQEQIICTIKIAFFVFWGPQTFLTMLQATLNDILVTNMFKDGLPAVTALATAHSFISPIIYFLLGSFKMEWMAHDPSQCRPTTYQEIKLNQRIPLMNS